MIGSILFMNARTNSLASFDLLSARDASQSSTRSSLSTSGRTEMPGRLVRSALAFVRKAMPTFSATN